MGLKMRPLERAARRGELLAGRKSIGVTIYSKPGCHLCHEAKEAILRVSPFKLELKEVNIQEDPELMRAYGEEIPVVFIQGRKAFKGRVEERRLLRLLREAASRTEGESLG